MSTKQNPAYVVGQRPPVTLTAKARKQLAAAKPSIKVASFAKIVAKLVSTPVTSNKNTAIPELQTLKPGDITKALSAKDAACVSFSHPGKNRSKKRISKAA
jgi:hypothetical protein